MGLLELTDDELLEAVEAVAATGSTRAERMLALLLDEEQRTGRLSVVSRLACRVVLEPGASHDEGHYPPGGTLGPHPGVSALTDTSRLPASESVQKTPRPGEDPRD